MKLNPKFILEVIALMIVVIFLITMWEEKNATFNAIEVTYETSN